MYVFSKKQMRKAYIHSHARSNDITKRLTIKPLKDKNILKLLALYGRMWTVAFSYANQGPDIHVACGQAARLRAHSLILELTGFNDINTSLVTAEINKCVGKHTNFGLMSCPANIRWKTIIAHDNRITYAVNTALLIENYINLFDVFILLIADLEGFCKIGRMFWLWSLYEIIPASSRLLGILHQYECYDLFTKYIITHPTETHLLLLEHIWIKPLVSIVIEYAHRRPTRADIMSHLLTIDP